MVSGRLPALGTFRVVHREAMKEPMPTPVPVPVPTGSTE